MEPTIKKLTSRKFLFTIIVLATVFLNALGVTSLESAELFSLVASASAFIFGESVLDRERIKATQLVNLQQADENVQRVIGQANEVIAEKDALVESLQRLLNEAADGEDGI